MELFGDFGVDKTTIRQIASRAGVSPGLVIHHFGSKSGLREAVDDRIMEKIAHEKDWFRNGVMPQPGALVEADPELVVMTRYLVQVLRHDGPAADQIFDRMCDLTDEFYAEGLAAGLVREPSDRVAAVATLVAYAAGASILGHHLARRLGGASLLDAPVFERYERSALELFTKGFFADPSDAAAVEPDSPGRKQ